MSLYSKYILPKILDKRMASGDFNSARESVARQAVGTVLEIGFGSGYNLPFYKNITKLYALEPSTELIALAKDRIDAAPFPIIVQSSSAEKIPLGDASVDTVISTWTLCSIPNVLNALREIIRVLKPNGKFVFAEHGRSSRKMAMILQRLITPIYKNFAGNCHLDREIDSLIVETGLKIISIEKMPESGRPLMFSYKGVAIR